MIKKLKIGLLIVVLTFFAGIGVAQATAPALDWDADTTVTIGTTNYTIELGSAATSIIVGTTSLTVTVPASSTFTLTSASRFYFDTANADATRTCTSTESTVTLTGATSAVVITPHTETLCESTGGGSGGGSSRAKTPVTPAVPATPAVPGEIPGCGNRTTGFSSATGVSCAGNTATTPAVPAVPAVPASNPSGPYNFGTTTLKNGSRGEAVQELQRFLNAKLNLGLVVDGKLGPKTIAVIKQWQRVNGLVADGLVGRLTKAKMNSMAQ
jgi:hypothetical protein